MVVAGTNTSTFSDTPDLALVKAVIAHAARRAESEDIVVAVFDVRRSYVYAEEKRDTFVELPDCVPAEFRTAHAGKLRKALYGTRPAAASWRDESRKGLVSCSLTVGTVSRCCFHKVLCSVARTVHGDDIFVASPRQGIAKMGATLKKRWDPSMMIRRNSAFSLVRCDGARMGWQIEWTMTGHSRTTTSRRKELCTRRCVCVVKCS